jgi:dihydrolipoamide dehydrogenase
VHVLRAHARFRDGESLELEGDDVPGRLGFDHAILATGSAPIIPPPMRSEDERIMDSTAALDLPVLPRRLLVVGGGYIGLELGTVYAALGAKVTVVEMTGDLLPGVDRDLVRPLEQRLEHLFAVNSKSTRVVKLEAEEAGVRAHLDGPGVDAQQLFDRALVAVGRRARIKDLGLESTGARVREPGFIVVDERCRTDDPHIYAVGDATGEPLLAHRAMRQGKVAAEVIAGKPAAFDNTAIPAVVFTDPEIAWCGLTEREAEAQGRPVRLAKFPWAASGRAATLGRADGLTKLIVDPHSGRVLGVGIVGPAAGELIGEATLAVEAAVTAEDLAATIHAHPTLAETLMEAAEAFLRAAG